MDEYNKHIVDLLISLIKDIENGKAHIYGHELKSDFTTDYEKSKYYSIVKKPNGVKHLTIRYKTEDTHKG